MTWEFFYVLGYLAALIMFIHYPTQKLFNRFCNSPTMRDINKVTVFINHRLVKNIVITYMYSPGYRILVTAAIVIASAWLINSLLWSSLVDFVILPGGDEKTEVWANENVYWYFGAYLTNWLIIFISLAHRPLRFLDIVHANWKYHQQDDFIYFYREGETK